MRGGKTCAKLGARDWRNSAFKVRQGSKTPEELGLKYTQNIIEVGVVLEN